MSKCTRQYYDEPLLIRDIKLLAALQGSDDVLSQLTTPLLPDIAPVAIIGAGPAGLAAAAFLRRAGVPVTVFEQRNRAGGLVQYVIPDFRLPEDAVEQDMTFLKELGVDFIFNADPQFDLNRLLEESYSHVFLAVGATLGRKLEFKGDTPVLDAVDFLTACRCGQAKEAMGSHVVVIGGGNSAMDSARVALRFPGVKSVTIAYRRTRAQMPADLEEYAAALAEGVSWRELISPLSTGDGRLTCQPMQLAEPGADGRRRVHPADCDTVVLPCDTLIAAVGETVDGRVLSANDIKLTDNGTISVATDTLATNQPHILAGGDARRGPATVVQAIADGRRAAEVILNELDLELPSFPKPPVTACPEPLAELYQRRGTVALAAPTPLTIADTGKEAHRCLACDLLCNRCVDVCPNRANIAMDVERLDLFQDRFQILHLEGLCNECGNCVTFCPHDGSPWRDKPTLFSSKAAFDSSSGNGFLLLASAGNGVCQYRIRLGEQVADLSLQKDGKPLEPVVAATLARLPQGEMTLRLLQLLHTDYDYLLVREVEE
ncbi:MAG: FAD-dependent oxidoreductase, partial [Pirellulales bacterium]|nr:FAD-dependent oxidoreductase [Pirellulales bacterium]